MKNPARADYQAMNKTRVFLAIRWTVFKCGCSWVLICFLLTFMLAFIQKNNDAVSPVIGTILMVAIVVILAAIIAAYSFGMFSEQKIAPQASVRIISVDTSANTVTLEHQGGGDLILSYVKVIVEQGNNRISFETAGNSSNRFVLAIN